MPLLSTTNNRETNAAIGTGRERLQAMHSIFSLYITHHYRLFIIEQY